MNTEFDNDKFDRQMRQLHAESLAHVSPQTLAKLRSARHSATRTASSRGHGWRWLLAGVAPAVLAVAIGVQFMPAGGPQPTVAAQATAADDEYVATLSENPDLYLWLESDGRMLAME